MYNQAFQNTIKGLAHSSGVGTIALALGISDIADVSFSTLLVLVLVNTLYNCARELLKAHAKGKELRAQEMNDA